jgi:hypothetical protein
MPWSVSAEYSQKWAGFTHKWAEFTHKWAKWAKFRTVIHKTERAILKINITRGYVTANVIITFKVGFFK